MLSCKYLKLSERRSTGCRDIYGAGWDERLRSDSSVGVFFYPPKNKTILKPVIWKNFQSKCFPKGNEPSLKMKAWRRQVLCRGERRRKARALKARWGCGMTPASGAGPLPVSQTAGPPRRTGCAAPLCCRWCWYKSQG